MDTKAFLGAGLAFPMRISSNGTFVMNEHEENIRQSINLILSTAPGERVMRPDFGCGIHDLVFAVLNSSTLAQAEALIMSALSRFEPRIIVNEVKASVDQNFYGKLIIKIDYEIRETNNAFNYVYDFYLREGNG